MLKEGQAAELLYRCEGMTGRRPHEIRDNLKNAEHTVFALAKT
jgi:hypothetical protein